VALGVGTAGLAATTGVAAIGEAVGVAFGVDGLAVGVVVAVDGLALGVAVVAAVAPAAAVAKLVGVAEASAVAVAVTVAVLDTAALPSVAEGTGDATLEVSDGVGVDGATLGACEGVGETPGGAVAAVVAVATAVTIAELVGAAEAVVSGEGVILGEGCRISGCSRFVSGCDASPCARASITGNASIQIENPISNARKAQARVDPTITMPPSIARAHECFERRRNGKPRLLPFSSNTRRSKGRAWPTKDIGRGG